MKEVIRGYFAVIPAEVRYDKRLTANAKLMYGEITALCNEKGYCWANNDYFSELYGVSTTSVSAWIKQLIDFGYIDRDFIYNEGTKEIKERHLIITRSYADMCSSFSMGGIQENLNEVSKISGSGGQENLKDNNITVNNKRVNNTQEYLYCAETREIVDYLNLRTGKNYRSTTPQTRLLIKARISEGFTVQDFKTVIDHMTELWKGTENDQYLRPYTLFGTKFESYLNLNPQTTRKPDKTQSYMGDESKYCKEEPYEYTNPDVLKWLQGG